MSRRTALIRRASELPAGDLGRRDLLARATKMARMPSGLVRKYLRTPEAVAFRKALDRDNAVEKMVSEMARDWTADGFDDGEREVPRSFGEINDEAYGSMMVTEYARINSATQKALDAAVAVGMALAPRVSRDDALEALDPLVKDYIDRTGWEDDVENTLYDLEDAAAEARDPYGYRGLSRSDFYASRRSIARVALRHLEANEAPRGFQQAHNAFESRVSDFHKAANGVAKTLDAVTKLALPRVIHQAAEDRAQRWREVSGYVNAMQDDFFVLGDMVKTWEKGGEIQPHRVRRHGADKKAGVFTRRVELFDDGDGYVSVMIVSNSPRAGFVTWMKQVNAEAEAVKKAAIKLHSAVGVGSRFETTDIEVGGAHGGGFELRASEMFGKDRGDKPSNVWAMGGGRGTKTWDEFIAAVKSIGWGPVS